MDAFLPGRANLGLKVLATLAAVLVALALAWPELLLHGLVPMTGDVLTFSFPGWKLTRDALATGHLPLSSGHHLRAQGQ